MDPRERILQAAAAIYAEGGFRGTTTRRVSQEAGVNEVTLFRHFGTKEVLIREALEKADRDASPPIPGTVGDPGTELFDWALATFRHWYLNRHLICRVMGDLVEHPEIAPGVCAEPGNQHHQLAGYLSRMRDLGLTTRAFEPDAAAGLLMGALFTHAVWRDQLPDVPPEEAVVRGFVDLLLQAVGAGSSRAIPT